MDMRRKTSSTSAEDLLELLRDKGDGDERSALLSGKDAGTPMLPLASLEAASTAATIYPALIRRQFSPSGPVDMFDAWNNGVLDIDPKTSPNDGFVRKDDHTQQNSEATYQIGFKMVAEKPSGAKNEDEPLADGPQGAAETSSAEGDTGSSDDAWATDRGHGSSRGMDTSEGLKVLPDPRADRKSKMLRGICTNIDASYRNIRRATRVRQQSKPYDSLVDPKLPREEVRRLRRTLSNRESARRARKRRSDQISALEAELEDSKKQISDLQKALDAALEAGRAAEAYYRQLAHRLEICPNDFPSSLPVRHNGVSTKINSAPARSTHLQSPLQLMKMRQSVGADDAVNHFSLRKERR